MGFNHGSSGKTELSFKVNPPLLTFVYTKVSIEIPQSTFTHDLSSAFIRGVSKNGSNQMAGPLAEAAEIDHTHSGEAEGHCPLSLSLTHTQTNASCEYRHKTLYKTLAH